jgi:phosphoribosylanthranilate isomerase
MEHVRIKCCGLNTEASVDVASDLMVDFAGFVVHPLSPRHVDPEMAGHLAARLGPHTRSVAVLVNPDDTLLAQVMGQMRPDFLQLHGLETPERVAEIKELFDCQIIKAIRVGSAKDIDHARTYEPLVDWLLFDAAPPKGSVIPGGNGVSFDAAWMAGQSFEVPWMLSGGLHAENAQEAIRASGAWAVDVSSGIEASPGTKDHAKMRAFVAAVREVNHAE